MAGLVTRRDVLVGIGSLPLLAGCSTPGWHEKVRPKLGLNAVTLGVSDINRALALFQNSMGLTIESRGKVSSARLELWGLPTGMTAEMVELSCAGYPIGRLRILRLDSPPSTFVRNDFGPDADDSPYAVGPKALAFYAKGDVNAAADDFLKYGLEPRSRAPIAFPGGKYEYSFTGVGRAPTIVIARPKARGLDMRAEQPTDRYSEIVRTSIICDDLVRTRQFYSYVLGLKTRLDEAVSPGFESATQRLFGVPEEFKMHRLLFTAEYEPSGKIMVLGVSNQNKERLKHAMGPRHRGICIYSFGVSDLSSIFRRVTEYKFDVIAPPSSVDGARMMVVRGPNGEFCELIEGT